MSLSKNNSYSNYNINSFIQSHPHSHIYRPITSKPTSFYPHLEQTNTSQLNPLFLSSLKNANIDNIQATFNQVIQNKNHLKQSHKNELEKMLNENKEIINLRQNIQNAKLHKYRSQQINENNNLIIKDLHNEYKEDENILSHMEANFQKAKEIENQKRQERLQIRYIQQQQIKDRQKEKDEIKKQHLKEREIIDEQIRKAIAEDIAEQIEKENRKNRERTYLQNAFIEKEQKELQKKEEEKLEQEKEKKYLEEVEKREAEYQQKKVEIQLEGDNYFKKLYLEKAREQAEKDYWANIRNELYIEQEKRKVKIAELEEKEKKQKQKEEMLQSAIEQIKMKELKKQEEQKMENEFKRKLMEKYKEDEKLEQYNTIRRKQKELDYKNEIEKQWKRKLEELQLQQEKELQELENKKHIEETQRILIEQEKARLIKENEELLKQYNIKGYYSSVSSLHNSNSVN
jgi:hypothetical protein